MTLYAKQQRRTLIFVVLFFVFLTATIGAVGYKSYRNFEAQSRADTERWLSIAASAKAEALTAWQSDLLDYAGLLYNNQAFSNSIAAYLRNAQDIEARTTVLDELQAVQRRDEIDGIDLLDSQGVNLLSIPTEAFAPASAIVQKIPKAIQTRQIIFIDFYRAADTEPVQLAVLVPVLNANLVIGFVVLRVDPQVRLYPALAREIVDIPTMQTYLVRREGDSAVILSPLSYDPEAVLRLRIPMEQAETLEVKAVQGQTGIIEGQDYLGGAVIADVRSVPQGWVLVTQTSIIRMYDSIRVYFGRTVVVTGTIVFYTGLGLALIWRQQLLKRYQAESEAAQRRAAELDAKVRERTAELSALSQQMADMHERQIRDLARELHDGVGQNLTAINLNMTVMHELLPADYPAAKARLADTRQLVEETVVRMRNVMADFLPPMLEHYGLPPALTWYGEQFTRRTNVQVKVRDLRVDAARLSPQAEIGLFRIAQEALNNTAKYARASQAEIELSGDGEWLRMTIGDDGVGFDPPAVFTGTTHWGFAIMRERARALDATLEIRSAPNAGTKIILRIPRQT
jgi:signal transduction histidine kinase